MPFGQCSFRASERERKKASADGFVIEGSVKPQALHPPFFSSDPAKLKQTQQPLQQHSPPVSPQPLVCTLPIFQNKLYSSIEHKAQQKINYRIHFIVLTSAGMNEIQTDFNDNWQLMKPHR